MNQEIKNIIDSIDLDVVTKRLAKNHGYSEESARLIERQYRNFLYLRKEYDKFFKLPPSTEIDLFWHEHILNTKKYMKDCISVFGEYLHHTPGHADEEMFEKTQCFYKSEFGTYLYQIKKESLLKKMFKFILK